jgi:hypothetical protein
MFIYVDDVYIASSTTDALNEFTVALQKHFELKILGIPRQLLGIQIQWADGFKAVHLSASKLITKLVDSHHPKEEDIRKTPMETAYRPTKASSPSEEEQLKPEMKKLKQDSIRNVAEKESALDEIKKVREVLIQKKSKLNTIK